MVRPELGATVQQALPCQPGHANDKAGGGSYIEQLVGLLSLALSCLDSGRHQELIVPVRQVDLLASLLQAKQRVG
jgi:hypothetical protein